MLYIAETDFLYYNVIIFKDNLVLIFIWKFWYSMVFLYFAY